jgi:glucose-1-phosphate thymidylyltransferase
MEIAKALILTSDADGERPWSNAPVGSRHLFPVANRPILFHNLDALRAAGVVEVAILADPATAPQLRDAVGRGDEWGLSVRYADWQPSGGLGGALSAGRDFVDGEPVLLQQGDAFLRERMHAHITAFAREGLDALELRLRGGKAGHPPADLTPGHLLSARAVDMLLDSGAANPVAGVRARGGNVRVQDVDGCLACHGDVSALLESNRRMLEGLQADCDTSRFEDCTIQGDVDIDPTARVERTLLRGPAIIGPGAQITDAYIGPYTSIGAGALVEGSEIEHSIVLQEAQLRFVGTRLESSVIGRGARIVRGFELPGAIRVSIGDGAEVVIR